MMMNPTMPPQYIPSAAEALLTLAAAVSDPKRLKETLDFLGQQYDRVETARAELNKALEVFENDKRDWYAKSAREEDKHKQKMAAELAAHHDAMAQDRAALDAEREAFKEKVDRVTAAAMGSAA